MLLGEDDGGQDGGLSLKEQLRHISPKEYPIGSSLLLFFFSPLFLSFLTIEKRGQGWRRRSIASIKREITKKGKRDKDISYLLFLCREELLYGIDERWNSGRARLGQGIISDSGKRKSARYRSRKTEITSIPIPKYRFVRGSRGIDFLGLRPGLPRCVGELLPGTRAVVKRPIRTSNGGVWPPPWSKTTSFLKPLWGNVAFTRYISKFFFFLFPLF